MGAVGRGGRLVQSLNSFVDVFFLCVVLVVVEQVAPVVGIAVPGLADFSQLRFEHFQKASSLLPLFLHSWALGGSSAVHGAFRIFRGVFPGGGFVALALLQVLFVTGDLEFEFLRTKLSCLIFYNFS